MTSRQWDQQWTNPKAPKPPPPPPPPPKVGPGPDGDHLVVEKVLAQQKLPLRAPIPAWLKKGWVWVVGGSTVPAIYRVIKVSDTHIEYEVCRSLVNDTWERVGSIGREAFQKTLAKGARMSPVSWQEWRQGIIKEIFTLKGEEEPEEQRLKEATVCKACQGRGINTKGVPCPCCTQAGKRYAKQRKAKSEQKAAPAPKPSAKPAKKAKERKRRKLKLSSLDDCGAF